MEQHAQMTIHHDFLARAIDLALRSIDVGGGPFGAVIAKDNIIIAEAMNESRQSNDPTAHAELLAIRAAGVRLQRRNLGDCILYTSCEPCPMCLAACYWAEISSVIYACSGADAAAIGYPDSAILAELCRDSSERRVLLRSAMREEGLHVFQIWASKLAGEQKG
jgi:tRNA(Arg) A34 adenosine deaminase TadA